MLFVLLFLCQAILTTATLLATPENIVLLPILHAPQMRARQSNAQNIQSFTEKLGNIPASAITQSTDPKRPFNVEGNTFPDFKSAAQRSCDVQFNGCQQMANSMGNGKGGGSMTVQKCETQKSACNTAQQSAKVKEFFLNTVPSIPAATSAMPSTPTTPMTPQTTNIGPDPAFPDFDLICEL